MCRGDPLPTIAISNSRYARTVGGPRKAGPAAHRVAPWPINQVALLYSAHRDTCFVSVNACKDAHTGENLDIYKISVSPTVDDSVYDKHSLKQTCRFVSFSHVLQHLFLRFSSPFRAARCSCSIFFGSFDRFVPLSQFVSCLLGRFVCSCFASLVPFERFAAPSQVLPFERFAPLSQIRQSISKGSLLFLRVSMVPFERFALFLRFSSHSSLFPAVAFFLRFYCHCRMVRSCSNSRRLRAVRTCFSDSVVPFEGCAALFQILSDSFFGRFALIPDSPVRAVCSFF